jgi:Fe2+-dicitrate sensor, membrane component
MEEKIRHLIKKHIEGSSSLKEQIELSELLADPGNKTVEQILSREWSEFLTMEPQQKYDHKLLLDRVHHQIRLKENIKNTQTRLVRIFQRVAAILILPLLFSFLAYYFIHSKTTYSELSSFAEIQCPLGVRTKFQLPDGTTGYLNSGARLKYPIQFKAERKVELVGEAFFHVIHNKEIPFHVNTRHLDIKVLGTTFNVVANDGEQTEEVVLQTGKVDVLSKSGDKLISMVPNEQLILNIEKRTFCKKEVEASQYSTWKDGRLVFRNENMQQLAKRLSRWYNAEVVVEDHILNDYTFHATFIDEPLDEVLKLISLTSPISYKEEKRTSNQEGVYQRRKIILRIDQTKIKDFK